MKHKMKKHLSNKAQDEDVFFIKEKTTPKSKQQDRVNKEDVELLGLSMCIHLFVMWIDSLLLHSKKFTYY